MYSASLSVERTLTDYAFLSVDRTPYGLQVRKVTCEDALSCIDEISEVASILVGNGVLLRVNFRPEAVCTFSYSTEGETFIPIDTELTAIEGRWIGTKVGLFCLTGSDSSQSGHTDFDRIRCE